MLKFSYRRLKAWRYLTDDFEIDNTRRHFYGT